MRLAMAISTMIIALALAAASCSKPANNAAQNNGGEPPVATDNGDETPPLSTAQSDANATGYEEKLPDGWVEGIPLIHGFEVREFQGDGETMMATCIGWKPIPKVYDFYDDLDDGWVLDPSRHEEPGVEYRLLYYTKGERELMIMIGRNEMGIVLHMEVTTPEQRQPD